MTSIGAAADRPAKAKLERRQHPGQHAAIGAEHKSDRSRPRERRALARRRRSQASQSPWLKQAVRAELGQSLVPSQAIPADRRAVDKERRLAVEAADQRDHIAGHAERESRIRRRFAPSTARC